MTRLRLAALSVAVVLFSTPVASADFLGNYNTNTNVPSDGGVAVTATARNSAGTVFENSSTRAEAFTTTVGSLVPSGTGALTNQVYTTYCVELTGTVGYGNNSYKASVETVPPAGPDPNGTNYPYPTSTSVLQRASWVIANASSVLSSSTAATIVAATQLAIWEIVYDAGVVAKGDVASYGLSSVNGAYGFKASGEGSTVETAANSLLNASWNSGNVLLGDGLVFRLGLVQNADGSYTDVGGGSNPQTLLAAVPEPSTFAIAGLGALGMLGYGLKRRKIS